MNNKLIGSRYEDEVVSLLCFRNFWAHFIIPDRTGAQPFDIIAVKHGRAYAIDCKTCTRDKISINRLEENQKSAFGRWIDCGNFMPLVAVKYKGKTRWIEYKALKELKTIPLEKEAIEESLRVGWVYDDVLEDFVICML